MKIIKFTRFLIFNLHLKLLINELNCGMRFNILNYLLQRGLTNACVRRTIATYSSLFAYMCINATYIALLAMPLFDRYKLCILLALSPLFTFFIFYINVLTRLIYKFKYNCIYCTCAAECLWAARCKRRGGKLRGNTAWGGERDACMGGGRQEQVAVCACA